MSACIRKRDSRDIPSNKTQKLVWAAGEDRPSAPISLTASDGTGLKLLAVDAHAVVQAPLAFTELHLKFENAENRVREGHFEITLPPGAAVSRFAMKIGDRWQEAEVVERQKARQTYEDFLHRRQDPALLEKKAGNQFSARVFPIAPRTEKELIISYSEELHKTPYAFHFAGLPKMAFFRATVMYQVSSNKVRKFTFEEKQYAPSGDLVLQESIPSDPAATWSGLKSGELAVARVVPRFDSTSKPFHSLTVLFDTSASSALGFAGRIERLSNLLWDLRKENRADFLLKVVCFDQTVFEAYTGNASGFGESHKRSIVERKALGASNLENALDAAQEAHLRSERVLLVSDGIATAGNTEQAALQKQIGNLSRVGTKRLDAVVEGGIRDEALLRALVTERLPETGVMVDGALPSKEIAAKMMRSTKATVAVTVPDANWVWPEVLRGVQSGDPVLIYVSKDARTPLRISLEGITDEPVQVPLKTVSGPLLERSAAIAQIDMASGRLGQMKDEQQKKALKKRIIDLSIAHRVLCDYTALLVLETEWDYARFDIHRNALTDILVVGKNGVEQIHRPAATLPKSAQMMGRRDSRNNDNHFGIRGPRENPDPVTVREQAASAAVVMPMSNEPVLDYNDLGLSGIGQGGGGIGEGTIGLGALNTIGHGGGGGSGTGYRHSAGGLGGRRGSSPEVRTGSPMIRGGLSRDIIHRIVRRHINEVKFCYEQQLEFTPDLEGLLSIKFIISAAGAVQTAAVARSTLHNPALEKCVVSAVRRWTFPTSKDGIVIVTYPFEMSPQQSAKRIVRTSVAEDELGSNAGLPPLFRRPDFKKLQKKLEEKSRRTAYDSRLQKVMTLLEQGNREAALREADTWRSDAPGDLTALVALGEAHEALGNPTAAARAYGSIIDLYPSRADMRRMAGQRLERLGETASELIVDTYKNAVLQRPDHPSSHRLYAWALVRAKRWSEAWAAMAAGVEYAYPGDRFAGVLTAMKNEMGLIGAAWRRQVPDAATEIDAAMAKLKIRLPNTSSTRFVLHWESDANDVDLHVYDKIGNHVFYQSKSMPTGGRLAADVTTGYGPEFFTIEGEPPASPYYLQAHYYNRGPMGYGMGTLQTIVHDGKGKLTFAYRPFMVMQDRAFVGLGTHPTP